MKMHCLTGVLYLLIISIVSGQNEGNSIPSKINPCTQNTCGKCIESDANCAWCSEADALFDPKNVKRCGQLSILTNVCSQEHLVFPIDQKTTLTDEELSNKGVRDEAIQLRPQHVHLKLRPNSPYRFNVQFRQAKDYPMDMYYLMDLSHSMKDDKANLGTLGTKLAQAMVSVTSNFRLGFGSFVDKKVMPFASTVPARLKKPCTNESETCVPPYGFFNQLPLNTNTNLFSQEVENANISGNLDNPEGGFDAIMQAIVCKLGGIIKPNDEDCHLDSSSYYSESTTQDYPSISQLNRKIRENKFNIIFAVTEEVLPLYRELTQLLEGSSAGELDRSSSNVVKLVKDQYNKITSSVELKDNSPNDIVIKYFSMCLDGRQEERSICEGLQVGKTVSFDVEITVPFCPKNKNEWNRTLQIYPVGLDENLVLDLELQCECDCEKPENEERNSKKCSAGNGTYECGICSCNQNRFGRLCECDLKESNDVVDKKPCIKPGDNKECSDRGTCRCGVCECQARDKPEEIVSGEYCECDNFNCEREDMKICSGLDHGRCECGRCICSPGWTGSACQCRSGNATCIGPDGKLCSDHGTCDCRGRCFCDSSEQRFTGLYCEECPTCPSQCDFYKDCVQCLKFETGKYSSPEECKQRCESVEKHLIWVEDIENSTGKPCQFKDESDGCYFIFKYSNQGQDPVIVGQLTKDCPRGPNVLAIVLGVTGGIVLAGAILLLVWKIFTTIQDNKEYARFEELRKKEQWNEDVNPLYHPSTSEFKNPTFDTGVKS